MSTMTPIDRREKVRVEQVEDSERKARIVKDVGAEWRMMIGKVTRVIYVFALLLEMVIGFRVILKLIAANSANDFAEMIFRLSHPFVRPFLGLTVSPSIGSVVLEIPSVIAMIVYWIIAWALIRLIWVVLLPARARQVTTYERG